MKWAKKMELLHHAIQKGSFFLKAFLTKIDLLEHILPTMILDKSWRSFTSWMESRKESMTSTTKMVKIKLSETFKNDLIEGEALGYFEDGSEAFIRNAKEGKPVGVQKEFYPPCKGIKGTLSSLYFHNDKGELHGEQKSYYPNGIVQTSIGYENGQLHGLKGLWDQESNLLEEYKYIKGKLEGRHFEKDQEGPEIVYHYKNNKREGPHYIHYPLDVTEGEKVKAIEGTYLNNKIRGKVTEYDPSGAKISITAYKNGKKDGDSELFHRNGRIAIRLTFKDDLREGSSYQYYASGQLYREVEFVKDQKEE
ncbi:hypothetical protein TrispH2_003211 [Trichoplax sp. H2]|nr:hypothetical protein TrispH2_003211 [Trichoplax sp. H2]|eukprot:RDD44956.1 hypothetical protein TrispH2_003211 [Trichoplax sp. H2]